MRINIITPLIKKVILVLFSLFVFLPSLYSQSIPLPGDEAAISAEEKARQERANKLMVLRVKERVEELIGLGEYENALAEVNLGLKLVPENKDLLDLKKKVEGLLALEEGRGDPSKKTPSKQKGDHNQDHFDIKSRPPERVENIIDSRNSFFIGAKGTLLHSIVENPGSPYDFTGSDYFSFGSEFTFHYYPSFFKKLIGISIDYDGMFLNFNQNDYVERYSHNPNIGLLLRGIMYEEPGAKMILGLGVSVGGIAYTSLADNVGFFDTILKVRIFFEDPFLYHLFKVPEAKDLIFKGSANFNYLFFSEIFYLDYELGFYYRFDFFETGIFCSMTDSDLVDLSFELFSFGVSANFYF